MNFNFWSDMNLIVDDRFGKFPKFKRETHRFSGISVFWDGELFSENSGHIQTQASAMDRFYRKSLRLLR